MVRVSLISLNPSSGGGEGSANIKGGFALKSGNGSTTQFIIPHGVVGTPTSVSVGASSSDALGEYWYTHDATNIIVNFAIPPANGTDNLIFEWTAFSSVANPDEIITFNRGTAIKDGNASNKVFTIAHGLTGTPQAAFAEAQTDDAKGSYKVTKDATNITITYPLAPPSGSGNLVFSWLAVG
jgi:hypothetical protein